MDIRQYQLETAKTDQVLGSDEKSIMVPLLGLAGEVGSLLTEYKKFFRDGNAYKIFDERIAEELGDTLWYVANLATKAGLNMEEIARQNLVKVRNRWPVVGDEASALGVSSKRFDEDFPSNEQLPQNFRITLTEIEENGSVKVLMKLGDEKMGNCITDNFYEDDGYRFHDVFHLSYAAILGWSPITRRLMKCKRKSNAKVDEVEDGARAAALEESISAIVFDYAKAHSFFEEVKAIDYELLRIIKNITSHLEVQRCSLKEWEHAILEGYRIWRHIRKNHGGVIIGDLSSRTINSESLLSYESMEIS